MSEIVVRNNSPDKPRKAVNIYEHTEFGVMAKYYKLYEHEFGILAVAFNKVSGKIYCSGNPAVVHSWIKGIRTYQLDNYDYENIVVIDSSEFTQSLVNRFHEEKGYVLEWYSQQLLNPSAPVKEVRKPKPYQERINKNHKIPKQNTWIKKHIQGDLQCSHCEDDYPVECECGGVIHQEDKYDRFGTYCDECIGAYRRVSQKALPSSEPKDNYRLKLSIEAPSGKIDIDLGIFPLDEKQVNPSEIWSFLKSITQVSCEKVEQKSLDHTPKLE